jgi:hypothetical protein
MRQADLAAGQYFQALLKHLFWGEIAFSRIASGESIWGSRSKKVRLLKNQ